jgi:hypothetical protein
MNPMSYEAIAPNIAQVEVSGPQVKVTWKCAATGRQIGQSTATMSPDASMAGRVQASVKRSIVSELTSGAARFLGGLLGGSAGRVINDAANTAASDIRYKATSGVDYSEASRQAAIVVAFESVQSAFAWDEQRQQYVAR